MGKFINLEGRTFGMLTVLKRAETVTIVCFGLASVNDDD